MRKGTKIPLQHACFGFVLFFAAICTFLVVYMVLAVSRTPAGGKMRHQTIDPPLVEIPAMSSFDNVMQGQDVESNKNNDT